MTPLAPEPNLTAAAEAYARLMAETDWFSHDGPDGSTFVSRIEAAGYTGWLILAENLYRGPLGDSPQSLVQAWANSSGHLSNMLNVQVTSIGVACYIYTDRRWCVQDFGAR